MSYLGLDFGHKRIGVAKSDELKLLAYPIGFIFRRSDEQVAQEVQKLIDDHRINKIVVGLPKTMNGEVGIQAQKVLSFVERLRQMTGCDCVTWDERLTTAQAEKALLNHDVSRAKRRTKRDAIAAELMLQNYLDFLHARENQKDD